jgi:hypothetical protein
MTIVRFLRGIVLLILAPIIAAIGYFFVIIQFITSPSMILNPAGPQVFLIAIVADLVIGAIIFGTGIYFIFTDSKKGEDVRIAVKKEPTVKEEHREIIETRPQKHMEEDHIKVLKMRYAKGEITKREFEEMRKTLIE